MRIFFSSFFGFLFCFGKDDVLFSEPLVKGGIADTNIQIFLNDFTEMSEIRIRVFVDVKLDGFIFNIKRNGDRGNPAFVAIGFHQF